MRLSNMRLPSKRGLLENSGDISICMSDLLEYEECEEITEETHSLLNRSNQNKYADYSEQLNEEIFSTLSSACSLPLLNDVDYDVNQRECIRNRRYRDLFKSTFKTLSYKPMLNTIKTTRNGDHDYNTSDFQYTCPDKCYQITSEGLANMPQSMAFKMRRSRSQTLNSNHGIVCSNEDLRLILSKAQTIRKSDSIRNRRRTHSLDSSEKIPSEVVGSFKHSVSATLYEESATSLDSNTDVIDSNQDNAKNNLHTLNELDEEPKSPSFKNSFNVAWGDNEIVDAGIFGEVIERHLENLKNKNVFKNKTCVSNCKSSRLMAQLCDKEIKNFECQSSFCSRLISRFKKMNLVYI